MIGRLRRAGLLWPTVLSIAGLAILIGLGRWQLARKAEKDALIAKIEASRLGQPAQLAYVIASCPGADSD